MKTVRAWKTRIRGVHVWLAAGAVLALVVVVNTIATWQYVTHRIASEETSREIKRLTLEVERAGATQDQLARVMGDSALWSVLRDRDGNVLARTGDGSGNTFAKDEVRRKMQAREPVRRVRDTESGRVLVEIMPLRVRMPDGTARMASLETALPLRGSISASGPVAMSTLLNATAALALLAAIVVIARRMRQYLEGRRLEQQLEIARQVQRDLLPTPGAAPEGVEFAAEWTPAGQVGGDIHDCFDAGLGRTAVVLGDVSGKGLPAALLMGVIHGAVRSANWTGSARLHEDAARRLNLLLCDRASGERYATLFWGYFDPADGALHYMNAGHCPPLLIRREGGRNRLVELDEGGPVLGLLRQARYRQARVDLRPGDLLVLYTDGAIEAENAEGEEFGTERLRAVVAGLTDATPEAVRAAVLDELRRFTGGRPLGDDLTLAAVRFAAVGGPVRLTAAA